MFTLRLPAPRRHSSRPERALHLFLLRLPSPTKAVVPRRSVHTGRSGQAPYIRRTPTTSLLTEHGTSSAHAPRPSSHASEQQFYCRSAVDYYSGDIVPLRECEPLTASLFGPDVMSAVRRGLGAALETTYPQVKRMQRQLRRVDPKAGVMMACPLCSHLHGQCQMVNQRAKSWQNTTIC